MVVVPDLHQPAAVLAPVKDAARRGPRSPAAILDRRRARHTNQDVNRNRTSMQEDELASYAMT